MTSTGTSLPADFSNLTTFITGSETTLGNASIMTSPSHHTSGADENVAGKAIAVIITLAAVAVLVVLGYCYLKRSGKLARLTCYKYQRTRRSSTSSSRRALDENDVMDPPVPKQAQDDMFTIEEYDEAHEEVGNKEEYFYDEVFGQSEFEDEATNTAMRELYSTRESGGENDEEMLDLDFETLGIKIDKMDSLRKTGK